MSASEGIVARTNNSWAAVITAKIAHQTAPVIPYDASAIDDTFIQTARQRVGYIYLQNDNLLNPWDSVPSYFGALLAALAS